MKVARNRRHTKTFNSFHYFWCWSVIVIFWALTMIGLFPGQSSVNSFDWSGFNPDVRDSVEAIADAHFLSGGVIGPAGLAPQQWHRGNWLGKEATESELLRLTDYPNSAVKAIAYEELIKAKPESSYQLLSKVLLDRPFTVDYVSGCEGKEILVQEYLMDYVLGLSKNVPSTFWSDQVINNLTDKELDFLIRLYQSNR
ncbi:hypothetical protein [Roseivirga sp.]|uniref:hypothetical protein n=1 Tax=Roseivirga sp. TaxID=1964215 RepID=UPI003B51DFAA